mmetsp:Transcript_18660/g.37764  ORF Transcript_18660/g.37764 Transcript_18660/m.37764 type:complete len:126 (+) Transcript_18660:472-849(+)
MHSLAVTVQLPNRSKTLKSLQGSNVWQMNFLIFIRVFSPRSDFSRESKQMRKRKLNASPTDLLPREAAALERMTGVVESESATVKQKVRSQFDELNSANYDMDMSPLFASSVGEVIRSFHTVTHS